MYYKIAIYIYGSKYALLNITNNTSSSCTNIILISNLSLHLFKLDTRSIMCPEKELYKSIITSLRDYYFV